MFSTLKFSTLRSRARNKETQDDSYCDENQYDDNDEADVSCGPSLRCQQPFNKCTIGKACGKQTNKTKYANVQKVCTAKSADQCPHTDVFLPNNEKYYPNEPPMYVTIKKTDVYIERDGEGNLGLTLQGGLHQNPEQSRPLVVTFIRPKGPTDKEGTIQVGDRLLAVDGYPLDNVTLNEAYNILRNGKGPTSRLSIEYDITNMKIFSGPLLVEMESPHPHHLGLTLTNTPHNAAVLIDEIKTASIAERCGALHPGDQILSINDTRIEGSRMPATEVYKLLRLCEGTHSTLLLQILPSSFVMQNQIDPKPPQLQYSPQPHVSFDTIYPNNYYEVPSEYAVPKNFRDSEPGDKPGKIKRMTITLHSDDRLGYGLSIYFSSKANSAVISSIIQGGPADTCQRLQVNDRILSINGMPIVGLSTDPQPLHKTPGIALGMVELSVEYDLQDTFVTVTDNLLTVDLTKHNKKNLGITMTGSSECMQISDIKQGSIGDRCGVLSIGDKILSINHHILANCSVQDALNILHSSSDTVSLQVDKQFFNVSNYNENVEYTIQLNKQNGPIGITITGSESSPGEVIISALSPGGVAEKTGALHEGDRVLEIDNHNVSNVLLSEAIEFLHNSADKVLFKVSRNSSDIPRNITDDMTSRIYGSPGLLSDDSAVESWESSTQRDVSPNDTPFQNVSSDTDGGEKCEIEHIIPNVIIPQNNVPLHMNEPIYSNIPHNRMNMNQYAYSYYNSLPYPNYKMLRSMDEQSKNSRNFVENLFRENYNKNNYSFSNVDEIFNIADHENADSNDNAYEIYQVILFKDPLYEDFGFSISDGLYERGVYLNRIRQGGPADKIGLLQPFDRIIQVNNTKTEDFDCCLTVPLIAAAGEKIALTVQRKKTRSEA